MTQSLTYQLYPEIQPFLVNMLQVGPIHNIYYEICGNPDGVPVIFLHGGPGSGCNPAQRRFFDPSHYKIVLFDQRGCGRSTPQGEVKNNTTVDLISDIEAIRTHLGIPQWHVFGGSWGSTLALAYAIAYPSLVKSLVLRGIFLSRPTELHWFLGEVKAFFPDLWQTLCNFLPADKRNNVINAYEALVFSDDDAVSIPAAIQWNAFEGGLVSLIPKSSNGEVNGKVELARARVQIYYIQQHCFVGGRDLLAEAKIALSHIPTVIVQGRYDMVCPPRTAWELSQSMPHSEFMMVSDAGHSAMEPGICSALVKATERFKSLK